MAGGDGKLDVVLFPWLAFGHMIPYLQLGKLLAARGHSVSFVSTPRNIQRLPKTPSINFVELPLPHDENLPEGAEATTDVPSDKAPFLKKVYDDLRDAAVAFVEESVPDWIIYDFAPYWLVPVAERLGISGAYFCTFNALSMSFFGPAPTKKIEDGSPLPPLKDLTTPPAIHPFPTTVRMKPFEVKKLIHEFQRSPVSGIPDQVRFKTTVSGCEAIFIRSCAEFEPEWLGVFGDIYQKPVVPVGLLSPSAEPDGDDGDAWDGLKQWLDKRGSGSVAYVALGSEVNPSQDEINELALGLEQSGLPFLWALRARQGSLELPEGFEDRTRGRGIVWRSWAPQVKILAHESVGGFVTHCGWSSIIEGLSFGKPLIMFPLWGDQGLNARAMAEKNVGLEIPRNDEDGFFTPDAVAESLRIVMVEEKGRIYREKAKEMHSLVGDQKLHAHYVDKLVDYLQTHQSKGLRK